MKKSLFGLLGAILLSASSWSLASVPTGVGAYAYGISFAAMYLPALDQPAEHAPIVADISHKAVASVMGIVANWQPGGNSNVIVKTVIASKQANDDHAVSRCGSCHAEVGWHRLSV